MTLVLDAQLAREMAYVDRGRVRQRGWFALPNAPIYFKALPSTGAEVVGPTSSGRDGWAKAKWEVPRWNRSRRIPVYVYFDGGTVSGVQYRRAASKKSTIYVTP